MKSLEGMRSYIVILIWLLYWAVLPRITGVCVSSLCFFNVLPTNGIIQLSCL